MRLKLSDIASITTGNLRGQDVEVDGIVFDGRQATEGDLFCAVVGEKTDGHLYIGQAAENGASAAMATRETGSTIPLVIVKDIPEALARIARHVRDSFCGPVVAVTGSVGKTTVKELTAAALSAHGKVLKSEGNQNTEYGLPMAWMKLQPEHKFAVMEMGMRGRRHIAHLCSFCKPNVAVITAIGTAHLGELGSRGMIADAKAEILECLDANGSAILPRASDFLDIFMSKTKGKAYTFGAYEDSDIRVLETCSDVSKNSTRYVIQTPAGVIKGVVPGLGEHQGLNAAAALAVCYALDLPLPESAAAMAKAKPMARRLSAVEFRGAKILVDVYNSSPESCIQALRALADAPTKADRIAILGDMLELGDFTEEAHRNIGAEAARLRLDRLVVVGDFSHWFREGAIDAEFPGRIDSLSSVDAAARILLKLNPGDIVLIKGSRAMQMERALELAGVPD